ncbi:MAG: CinA family protein [Christensenellales bacterium]|jgi:nicotinamide-nucleotide amidase
MDKIIKLYGNATEIEQILDDQFGGALDYELEEDNLDVRLCIFDAEQEDIAQAEQVLDERIYNTGDISLQKTLVDFLSENNLTVATAESCTGGLLSAKITQVPGASEIFYEGIVSYTNSSKQIRLGVKKDTLIRYGAVSREAAMEMARGVLEDKAQIGISITGIAGPGGGSLQKPVGLVYIAVASDLGEDVFEYIFSGDRDEIREKSVNTALYKTFMHIMKYY